MDEITIPFFARFATTSRAVGVPRSVKTVSKFTVSRENVNTSEGDVLNESLMQEVVDSPITVIIIVETKKKNVLMNSIKRS